MGVYSGILYIILLLGYAKYQTKMFTQEKREKYFLILGSFPLVFITAFRSKEVGADTAVYYNHFLVASKVNWAKALDDRFEKGFLIYQKILAVIFSEPQVIFIITAIFFGVVVAIYIKRNSTNGFLSLLLYYTVGQFSFQLTGMRQSIAMAILLLSTEFIKKRKLIPFILTVILAYYFHKSSLAFLPIYFFAYHKVNFRSFLVTVTAIGATVVLNKYFILLFNFILGYEYNIGKPEGGVFVVIMLALTILLCYFYSKPLLRQSNHNLLWFNITTVSLVIYVLRYFMQAAERISFYYQFGLIILLPNAINAIEDKKTRNVVYGVAIILACALFLYRIRKTGVGYYKFFWEK
jgi:hypothetical protein